MTMPRPIQKLIHAAWAGVILAPVAPSVCGQTTNFSLRIARSNPNVTVAWTNRGTLQSAASPAGPWRDVLEAPNLSARPKRPQEPA
jgi:hypothetical protein